MRLLLTIMTLVYLHCTGASAQEKVDVVFLNSDPVVAVHSNFRGQTVTLFGSIEPVAGELKGRFSVVVLVQGPLSDWVVREKERQMGLVLNSASAYYLHTPGYYAILSSSPLSQIASSTVRNQPNLSFAGIAASARDKGYDGLFDEEFVRLMRKSGNYVEGDRSVVMHSSSLFSVRIPLASNAANGLYLARAFILSDGAVVAETTTRFTVRTLGFERYMADTARNSPAIYGLASVIVALATGWLGGVLFRR